DEVPQARLVDGDDAGAEVLDALRIDVHAEHVVPQLGHPGPRDEAHVGDPERDKKHRVYLAFLLPESAASFPPPRTPLSASAPPATSPRPRAPCRRGRRPP